MTKNKTEEKITKCFNCKKETEDTFIIDITVNAKFSAIFHGIGDKVEAKDTTQYHNKLCPQCSIFIARLLSDNVRPPEHKGRPYTLVQAEDVVLSEEVKK